jgi:ribose transport system ATP-binding protein
MKNILLRARGLGKVFTGHAVLKDIDLDIDSGEIVGVIGENGAGKSTLMKILSGIHQPSAGVLEWSGRPVVFRSAADARDAGVSLVPQEFNLAADLTVVENVFLGAELRTKWGFLDRSAMVSRTNELLRELGANVDANDRIDRLSAAQKQFVEISKALAFDSRLLILDEPTTMLTKLEIRRLLSVMRDLKSRGMTQVYISHKLAEVKEICDRVVILKDGVLVHQCAAAEIEPGEMARRMVGRELKEIYPPKIRSTGPRVLEVRGLSSPAALTDVSFFLRKGEILGFSGLVGSGRTETAEALMGLRPHSGTILLDGEESQVRRPADAVRLGLGYLSEDRQGTGIVTSFGIAENMTLGSLAKYLGWFATVDRSQELQAAVSWRTRFSIKASDLNAKTESLSGGNQQKVSLAKTLDPQPKVVIVDEPTRGVDVAAKQEIYRFLVELAREGTSVILISSEMEEILGLCDRVVVMREGRLAGELEGDAVQEDGIMELATGIK